MFTLKRGSDVVSFLTSTVLLPAKPVCLSRNQETRTKNQSDEKLDERREVIRYEE